MVLPYAPNAGPLINKPYITAGQNTYVTWGGTLKKRPGLLPFPQTLGNSAGFYPERLWIYETLEANPVVYLIGSAKNVYVPNKYGLIMAQLSPTQSTPNWQGIADRRGCSFSVLPHEGVVRRGKLYIKGFPLQADDPSNLGSIYLDGTGGTLTIHDWGALGPQTPVALSTPSGWSSSAHPVTVNNSWIYTYTYVKVSGQETNQAPLQTNPDSAPSATGHFVNKIPNMTVQGLADTTEYPFINIYRTTDGGGSFYFLFQIANTGAGSITFNDTHLVSSSGQQDPQPDTLLDTRHQAPSTTSNGPPPTVSVGTGVTGTSAIQQSTRCVEYAARIWFAVGEDLFYSANEELDEGVPEESFPSGEATPNFFRFNALITNLIPTPDGLLVMTKRDTTLIYGTSKATFNPRPLLGNIGAAATQPRAATTASELQAWLTHDYRIAVLHGQSFSIISNPINNLIKLAVDAGAQIDLQFWTQADKEYLIVAAHNTTTPTSSKWFVYDLDRARRVQDDFWFTPWFIGSSCLVTGAFSSTDTENKLFVALWDGTATLMTKLDYTGVTATDMNPTTGLASTYAWNCTTSLLMVPAGDHVNLLRRPDFSPNMASFQYERTIFTSDSDPHVNGFFDDLFTTPVALAFPGGVPARRVQSQGFKTIINYDVNKVAKYAAFQIVGNTDAFQAEIHNCTWSWLPDSGA